MIFDQPPAELPTATLRTRESSTRFSIDVSNWFAARWRWFRPRTVPVFVAFVGLVALLASARYLRNLAHEAPEQVSVRPLQIHIASNEPTTTATRGIVRVEMAPQAAVIHVEGSPVPVIPIAPGVYRIQIVPHVDE